MAADRALSHTVETLGPAQRLRLVALARAAVERTVRGEPLPGWQEETGALSGPGAAFVTLHHGGRLRGCIGCIEPRAWSLAETVVRMAVAACQDDPRFGPVREEELADLSVEVSVLGPLVPVEHLEEVELGRDGVVVEEGVHRGLLLPQVATEWGWDRETLVSHACRKAGLEPDAWRTGAQVFRFEALVFGEGTPGTR